MFRPAKKNIMFHPAKKEEFSFDIYQYSKDHWPLICLQASASVALVAVVAATLYDGQPIVVQAISASVSLFVLFYAATLYDAWCRARVAHLEHAIKQDASPGLRP
jgi:hypothetical protein